MTLHENQNPLDLVLGRLGFPHSPALFGLSMSSTVGLLQYVYSVLLVRREGPFPLWMHTFYLAHGTTWAYRLAFGIETAFPDHWLLLPLLPMLLARRFEQVTRLGPLCHQCGRSRAKLEAMSGVPFRAAQTSGVHPSSSPAQLASEPVSSRYFGELEEPAPRCGYQWRLVLEFVVGQCPAPQ
ncbi:hypothetical protein BJX68DRAFT_157405 [Aspergillus pseudodeflectus]|uniref:Uncharacterized protein n=1 Tax=Aspergillus pseudodeflectus TaxID=176178 RepID=A0ABR4JTE3_9EURO